MKEMETIHLKKIFTKLKEIRHVVFCGIGEPLLSSNLFEMIKLCNKNGKETTLYTNGILLSESNIEKIFANNVSSLVISIKGADEKDFSLNTGLDNKTFVLIINNIKALTAKKKENKHPISIALHYVCSRDKMENMEKMVELANTLNVDQLSFNNLACLYPAATVNFKHAFVDSDKEVMDKFKLLKEKSKIPLKLPPLIKKTGGYNNCISSTGFVMVDGLGNVSPCCRIPPKEKFGNIFTDKNVLNNKTFVFLRRALRTKPMHQCLICHSLLSN
jgi:MoaA/NifB/PqqE/SkfB family radical SAM enzyme